VKRDLAALEAEAFDVVVVGAGIYGACIARDAAKRGLRTALIERGDFGAATSHNSFKLVHGGLRYLQQLDIQRLRQSALEQRRWLRIAPHLVEPLAFVMPTIGRGSRSPLAMRMALGLYDLLAKGGEPEAPLVPAGRVVDRTTCARLLGGFAPPGMNGGAIWHDVQMRNADRLLLECVIDAAVDGAVVANHVAATGFVARDGEVRGMRARDGIGGGSLEIRARLTINAAGPHAGYLLDTLPERSRQAFGGLARGMNLVVRRPLTGDHAIAVSSRRRSDALVPRADGRLFFIQPWQGLSLIGTSHLAYDGHPDEFAVDDAWLDDFLAEINAAYPPAALRRDDVLYCYAGLTPAAKEPRGSEVQRSRRGVVVDHAANDGIRGLVSVQGVKYTTARLVAEHLVDLAVAKLGAKAGSCRTWQDPLPGARGFDPAGCRAEAVAQAPVGGAERDRLVADHGAGWQAVLALAGGPSPSPSAILAGRVRHAVRHEMAMRLDDLLVRRLDEVATGRLNRERLGAAAEVMAAELGWSLAAMAAATSEFEVSVNRHRAGGLPEGGAAAAIEDLANHAN
jgi:glycerol-3-phosphate dehydrogenase